MGSLEKWLAGLFMVAYVLSPVDFLPDFLPAVGWMDDLALIGMVLYFIWTGRLPVIGKGKQFNRGFGSSGTGPENGRNKQTSGSGESRHDQKKSEPKSSKKPKDPYSVLGIKPGADKTEIREAYRKAAQAYHPDHVAHLGPELQELARKKFIEIKDAYEYLIQFSDK